MNEHEHKELKILIDSIGWEKFKQWITTVYCHALDANLEEAELTDLGSVLKERELIGAKKYLKKSVNQFEIYVTNLNKN